MKNNITVIISSTPDVSYNKIIEIKFTNVSLINSRWNISRLNLILLNVNMLKTVLSLTQGKSLNRVLFATISNSIFGQLNVNGNFSVNVSESNLDGNDGFGKALMNIKRCSLNIIDSKISNYSTKFGPAVLRSTESQVKISNIKFRQNIGKHGLIEILNDSRLELKHSLFENNGIGSGYNISHGSLVSIKFNSWASVDNCTFVENKGKDGACVHCDESSKLLVRDSSFVNNTGSLGGAIYCGVTDMAKRNKDCCCYGNNPKMFKPNGDGKCRSSCDFKNCTFRNNIAYEGKSLYIQSSSANIYNCSFEQTIAKYGGLVHGVQHSNIKINRTSFLSYTKKSINATPILISLEKFNPVVAVTVNDHCALNISNSQFVGGSFMEVRNYSTATVYNSTFEGHDQRLPNGIYFGDHAAGKFYKCVLRNNSASLLMLKNHTVVTMDACSVFNNVFEQPDDLIELDNRCHLNLLNSNIVSNKMRPLGSIIRFNGASALYSENCNYLNNSYSFFFLSSQGNTTVDGCDFIGNTGFATPLFYQNIGHIHIQNSIFRYNSVGVGYFRNASVTLKDSIVEHEPLLYYIFSDNCNTTINNCTVSCKSRFGMGMLARSDGGDFFNYLAIKRSHFRCDGGPRNQIFFNLAHLDIQNCSISFKGQQPGLNITSVLNVRIAYSEFYSDEENAVAIGFNTGLENRIGKTNLFTYQAKFRRKQTSTWSNNTQFFDDVKAQGLIQVGNEAFVTQEETVYASSKFKKFYCC